MKKGTVFCILLFCQLSYSQIRNFKPAVWQLLELKGELSLNGFIDKNTREANNSNNLYYGGGVMFDSKSYIWHPNFLILSIGANYSPNQGEYNSSSLPGYNTNVWNKNLSISANFFKNSIYNLYAYLLINQNFTDFENLRTVKRDINKWGGKFKYESKYPIWIDFEQSDEKEIDQIYNREIDRKQTKMDVRFEKSFFGIDRNEIIYRLNNYSTEQKGVFENRILLSSINFMNSLHFGENRNSSFFTNFSFSNISGFYNQKTFSISEKILFKIWKQINIIGVLNFNQQERNSLEIIKNTLLNGQLKHHLYKSLITELFINYQKQNKTEIFNLESNSRGILISYNKKITPLRGSINVVYSHSDGGRKNISHESKISTYQERYQLADGEITLLINNNIIKETVTIRDETKTLIYDEFIDYILIERANTIEVQRMLGGRIPNESYIFVDYQTNNNTSFDYSESLNSIRANLSLYGNLINFEYTNSKKAFNSDGDISFLTIDSYTKNTYGASINLNKFNSGIKYDKHNSSLFPYRLLSYYFNFNGKITNKAYFTINGNLNDYLMFYEEGLKQKSGSLSANIIYNLNYRTKLKTSFNYLEHIGLGQDIKLLAGKSEITTRINQLYLSVGINYYNRKIFESDEKYLGASIKIIRKF